MADKNIEEILRNTINKHISVEDLERIETDMIKEMQVKTDTVWDACFKVEFSSPDKGNELFILTNNESYRERPISVSPIALDDIHDDYKKDQSLIIGDYASRKELYEQIGKYNLLFKPVNLHASGNEKMDSLFKQICKDFDISWKLSVFVKNLNELTFDRHESLKEGIKKSIMRKFMQAPKYSTTNKEKHRLVFGIHKPDLFGYLQENGYMDFFTHHIDLDDEKVYAITNEEYKFNPSSQVPLAKIEYTPLK